MRAIKIVNIGQVSPLSCEIAGSLPARAKDWPAASAEGGLQANPVRLHALGAGSLQLPWAGLRLRLSPYCAPRAVATVATARGLIKMRSDAGHSVYEGIPRGGKVLFY